MNWQNIYSKASGLASLDESVYKKVHTKLYMDACKDLCDKIKYKGIDIKAGNIEMWGIYIPHISFLL